MTSLAVTLSVDSRGPSGLYIITDSRITWETSGKRWDAGQKVFASRKTADVFGFCGDAFFPPAILRQILEQVEDGLLFKSTDTAADRHVIVTEALKSSIAQRIAAPVSAFSVYHAARDGQKLNGRFRLWKTEYYSSVNRWNDEELDLIQTRSYLAKVDDPGATSWKITGATGSRPRRKEPAVPLYGHSATPWSPAKIRLAEALRSSPGFGE